MFGKDNIILFVEKYGFLNHIENVLLRQLSGFVFQRKNWRAMNNSFWFCIHFLRLGIVAQWKILNLCYHICVFVLHLILYYLSKVSGSRQVDRRA